MSNRKNKAGQTAILGLFAAIIVVLQLLSYTIKIGTFNLSLVLIPIVLAAVLYGPKYSAILGGVFGLVVTLASAFGLDAGGNILIMSSPVLTTLVCMGKGVGAGLCAGWVAKALKNKNIYLAVIAAALTAPIVNTGLFVAAMFLFFRTTLTAWAGGTDLVYYVIFMLVGINFVIELAVNIVLSPAVLRVCRALSKNGKKAA